MKKIPINQNINIQLKKSKKVVLKHYNDPKVFIEDSNDMEDIYKHIKEYNLGKKRK